MMVSQPHQGPIPPGSAHQNVALTLSFNEIPIILLWKKTIVFQC